LVGLEEVAVAAVLLDEHRGGQLAVVASQVHALRAPDLDDLGAHAIAAFEGRKPALGSFGQIHRFASWKRGRKRPTLRAGLAVR
jgi:hypothetical protein